MDREQLAQHLFSDSTKLYCVLDGVSVPDLPTLLYKSQAPNYCLLSGELAPDLLHAAPYVVYLTPDNGLADMVFGEGFGKHWGIFVHCRYSLKEMRRHFRSVVNVYDEQANSKIFRFYDPRVLRSYLPTCTPDDLKKFFGKVETFFAETDDGQNLSGFQIENDNLKQTEFK